MRGRRRVDAHLVEPVRKARQCVLAQAEPPVLPVVRRPVGDQVRLLRDRVEVLLQLCERHRRVHRRAVAHDVEAGVPEIHDPPAACVLDPGVADIPFLRHCPVERLRAGRDFADPDVDEPPERAERLPEALPRNAPADGIELGDEPVHGLPRRCRVELPGDVANVHSVRVLRTPQTAPARRPGTDHPAGRS